jgi:hypothetical protein
MSRKLLALLIASLLLWPAIQADVELVFGTGDTIKGREVRRDGNDYVLTTFDGGTVRIPMSDVAEVRLVDRPKPPVEPEEPEEDWPPTGLTPSEPQVLAGDKVTPPRTSEQLEVLGEPSKFPQTSYDPTWRPKSALGPDALADSRSTFVESSYDPSWQPESAFEGNTLDDSRSTWQEAPSDPSWVPQDGFAEKRERESEFWS